MNPFPGAAFWSSQTEIYEPPKYMNPFAATALWTWPTEIYEPPKIWGKGTLLLKRGTIC